MAKQNIAFIGLGIMGLPMAKNLANAGFNVTGYNRSPGKAQELATAGGRAASSIAEAVKGADVIITMVPDSPHVTEVVTGEDGVFANAPQGAYWIDNSSIRPDVTTELSEQARAAGIKPVDAPVSGGEQGAIDAVLSIMVGGEREDFEAVQDVLDAMGKTLVLVGPSGSGQTIQADRIDSSPSRPDVTTELSEQARAAGSKPVDAPVSGGEQGAIDAVLSIMVGGEREDFEAVQDVLDAMGKTIVLVGPSGSGQTVK